jgi:hypothetical protein
MPPGSHRAPTRAPAAAARSCAHPPRLARTAPRLTPRPVPAPPVPSARRPQPAPRMLRGAVLGPGAVCLSKLSVAGSPWPRPQTGTNGDTLTCTHCPKSCGTRIETSIAVSACSSFGTADSPLLHSCLASQPRPARPQLLLRCVLLRPRAPPPAASYAHHSSYQPHGRCE